MHFSFAVPWNRWGICQGQILEFPYSEKEAVRDAQLALMFFIVAQTCIPVCK
jgi:hypothetical protein